MIKYAKDYVGKLKEMYPWVSEKDILRIINWGWRMFYWYNLRGCDTVIKSDKLKLWMYCGEMTNDVN